MPLSIATRRIEHLPKVASKTSSCRGSRWLSQCHAKGLGNLTDSSAASRAINVARRRLRGGYTLLEMVLVLFIIALIIGIAIPVSTSLMAEEKLREHANALKLCAITARRLAMTGNKAYEIRFEEKTFWLQSFHADQKVDPDVLDSHALTAGTNYTIERWGNKKFSKPEEESWVFQPDGICEPVKVHFQSGKNWIEFAFNPLTARAEEETYYFK